MPWLEGCSVVNRIMRRQWVLIISLGLNGCLLILWLSFSSNSKSPAASNSSSAPDSIASNKIRDRVVVRKQFFLWQELESTDYRAYISNLAAIECPVQTMRDIIVADVNQAYLFRRLTEIKDPLESWWLSFPETNAVVENRRQRTQFEADRRSLLDTLLGTNWETGSLPAQFNVCLTGDVLGSSALESKHNVLEILQRSAQRKVSYELSLGISTREGIQSGYALLNRQTEQELAAVLTPSEMEEYMLRYSDVATGLRQDLQDVDLQKDEFLKIFHAVFPLRRQLDSFRLNGTNSLAQLADLQLQISNAIRGVLGMKRFPAYLARTDSAYRLAVQEASYYHGSQRVLQGIYKSLQTLAIEEEKVSKDSSLTPVEKQERINELRQEQLDTRDQILEAESAAANTPPPTPPLPEPPPYQFHRYAPGETVDQIAARYGIRPSDIIAANPDLNFQGLQRATPIKIPIPQK